MVDNIIKPFTFYTNTYAKANEVNADLDVLYKGVNACINQTNINTTDIESVGEGKADQNGDSSQTFNVADPTSGYNAVNRNSLWTYTRNSRWVISGLNITKDGSKISISSGACFDSSGSYLMYMSTSKTTSNLSLTTGNYYYVHLIGTKDTDTRLCTTGFQIQVTTSSTPTVSSDQVYRSLGTFYTTTSGSSVVITRIKENDDTTSRWFTSSYDIYNGEFPVGTKSWNLANATNIPLGDGNVYEVMFSVRAESHSGQPSLIRFKSVLNSSLNGMYILWINREDTDFYARAANTFTVPLSLPTVTFECLNHDLANIDINTCAYRRVL